MRRIVCVAAICAALLLMAGGAALAVTPPKIAITWVEPAVPSIRGGGTSVEIRDPQEPLVLLDQDGKPWLEMNGSSVRQRGQGGNWEEVRKENFYFITDGEIARYVVNRAALPYTWRISGTYDGRPFVMEGTLVPAGMKEKASASSAPGTGAMLIYIAGGLLVAGAGAFGIRRLVQKK